MINRTILIGFGEVGRAHFNVLKKAYPSKIFYKDKGPQLYDSNDNPWDSDGMGFDLMLIATQCDPANMEPFYKMVDSYDVEFCPRHIDILTTTPCLTAERIQERLGDDVNVTKSTIRGMHGGGIGLETFLYDIPKHIGGPGAKDMKEYYEKAGIPCIVHAKSRATELFHVLNNSDYGIAIAKAQENYDICRHYAVSYMEWLEYKKTNNEGFMRAGYPDKMSPVLTPPNGPIKGHCVVYSATTLPEDKRGPLMSILAGYNDKHKSPVKQDVN